MFRHLTLIDGSGFTFRAFHGRPPMTRADGTPVNAVYGFTTMLMKLMADSDADAVAVVFDAARKTFRNDLYPAYKAHRPPAPEELVPQFPLVREAARAFNLACLETEGFEADDLIATYARLAAAQGTKVTIVSSDKDLMQLVGGLITMFDPMKNRLIGEAEVREKFGVGPDKVVDVQALCGDSSDNVPGVPGIGIKTAAQLIETYGDLDTLLERACEITQPKRREALLQNAEAARLSRTLVSLRDDVPLDVPIDTLAFRAPDPAVLGEFLKAQGFRSLAGRLPAKSVETLPTVKGEDITTNYELVTTTQDLESWITDAVNAGLVAIDTETTSLDALRCDLVGISLATAPGRACYIPLRYSPAGDRGGLQLDSAAPTGKRGSVRGN